MLRKLLLSLAAVMVLTVSAVAYEVPHLETDQSSPFCGINTDVQDQADFLHALGLFQGTQQGYDLDRSMTRSEAAVMLVRLLGQEKAALAAPKSHPFTDVPSWADPYVGWLYANGLAKGVSPTAYGASSKVTAEQYLIFLTRALHGRGVADDYWKEGWEQNLKDLQQSLDQAGFLRRDAVSLSVLALRQFTDTGETLVARLLENKVIAEDAFRTEAPTIYESVWSVNEEGAPYRYTAGVALCGTETGLTYVINSEEGPNSYVLATRQKNGKAELCAVDCATLEISGSPIALSLAEGERITYEARTTNGDYLMKEDKGEDPAALLYYNGSSVQQLLDLTRFRTDMKAPHCVWQRWDNGFLLTLEDLEDYKTPVQHGWLLDGATVKALPALDDQDVVDVLGDSIIVQHVTEEKTVLQQLSLPSGQVLARFDLPHTDENPLSDKNIGAERLERTILDGTDDYYWGCAGLYRLENGVLHCILERYVSDLLVLDNGGLYVLSYTPGYPMDQGPFFYWYHCPGNEILYCSPDGAWKTLLGADSGHGIAITALLEPDSSGTLGFTCAKPNKYENDAFKYRLVRSGTSPSIRVESVHLVYPEIDFSWEQLPNYREILIQKEQQRLNNLGIGV